MNHHIKLAGLLLAGLLALPVNALAITYGNPVSSAKPGEIYGGVSMSETKRKTDETFKVESSIGPGSLTDSEEYDLSGQSVVFGYGIAEWSSVELSAGRLSIEDEDGDKVKGNAFGALFRFQGLMGSLQRGSLEDDDGYLEGDFTQLDLGYGLSFPASGKANLFGILLYSKLTVELDGKQKYLSEGSAELTAYFGFPVTVTSAKYEIEEDSAFGFVGGVEFTPTDRIRVAFELHAMNETGFAMSLTAGF